MSNRRSFHVLAGVPVLGCLLAMPSPARAQHETHVYGVANFGHTGECEDDTSLSHSVHTSTAECADDRTVEVVTLNGVGHVGPSTADGFDTLSAVWAFFEEHPAP